MTPRKTAPAKAAAPARATSPAPRKRAPAKAAAAPAVALDKPVRLDALADDIAALRRIEIQKARLSAKATPIIAAIKERMGDASQGLVGGKPAVRWSTSVRKTLDPKIIREKYPDVAEVAERITEVRKFEILPEVP